MVNLTKPAYFINGLRETSACEGFWQIFQEFPILVIKTKLRVVMTSYNYAIRCLATSLTRTSRSVNYRRLDSKCFFPDCCSFLVFVFCLHPRSDYRTTNDYFEVAYGAFKVCQTPLSNCIYPS